MVQWHAYLYTNALTVWLICCLPLEVLQESETWKVRLLYYHFWDFLFPLFLKINIVIFAHNVQATVHNAQLYLPLDAWEPAIKF